ncbi:MAG TPA: benzoyl-CoA reductase subunit C [Myxococcales bacterium]|nr:benzoyl-CoA reductase subunit C [Myxococcales bacterium]
MSHDPAATPLEKARELVEDLTFSHAKAWKAAHPGGLVVGHLPIYVPRPLFEAMGCLPVTIYGGGDQVDVVRGDSYFQSYICHIPRSTVELGVSGALDGFDAFVFPSTCDVIRNLSGMWKILFPQKAVAYLDMPQNFDAHLGGKFYALELRRIARMLEERGAKALTSAALAAAIEKENERGVLLDQLDSIRRDEPWRVRASEAYVAIRAGTLLPVEEHIALLSELIPAVRQRPARAYDNARVVVVGSFCEQPPPGLIKTLEQSGCDIVSDDFNLGLRAVRGKIEVAPGEDPLVALARAFIDQGTQTACRYVGKAKKGGALVETVKSSRADGVVFLAASFCDPALLDQPMLEAALDEASVPHTSVKFAENTGQFQSVREQAGAFGDSLKLWGAA